jgi:hypothetical protein
LNYNYTSNEILFRNNMVIPRHLIVTLHSSSIRCFFRLLNFYSRFFLLEFGTVLTVWRLVSLLCDVLTVIILHNRHIKCNHPYISIMYYNHIVYKGNNKITELRTIFQREYFSYIVAVSCIGREIGEPLRKSPTCRK